MFQIKTELQCSNGKWIKRLKENNIDSFHLGEHDIRIRTTPIPYVYHNWDFQNTLDKKPI